MSDIFFNKLFINTENINDEDRKHCVFTQSKWTDQEIELYLYSCDTNKTYKGLILVDELKESASELEIPYEEFYVECQTALTTTNLEVPPYTCELNESDLLFSLIKKQNVGIKYMDVKVKPLKNNAEMLEKALHLIEVAKNNEKIKREQEKQEEVSKEIMESLEKCAKMKDKLESRLLRKFTMILNTKKEKIIELQEKLDKLTGSGGDDSDGEDEITGNANTRRRRRRGNRIIDDTTIDDEATTTSSSNRQSQRNNQRLRKRRNSSEERNNNRDSNDSAEDDYEALTQVMNQADFNKDNAQSSSSSSPTKRRRRP